jgi:hypothetical protein
MKPAAPLALGLLAAAGLLYAYVVNDKTLDLFPPLEPTVVSSGLSTNKVKILRTPDGTLFAVYGEAQNTGQLAFDAKSKETAIPTTSSSASPPTTVTAGARR